MFAGIGGRRPSQGAAGSSARRTRRGGILRPLVAAALAVAALVVALPGTAASADPWSDSASLLAGRYDHTATRLGNGNVLVMGGASTTFLAAPELYDPNANTWTATNGLTSSSSSARQRPRPTLLANGKVLIAGGFTTSNTTSTTRIYDSATNVWSAGPNMVAFRYGHTAMLLQNGKVLVVGGSGTLASAEPYGREPTRSTHAFRRPLDISWTPRRNDLLAPD